MLCGNGKLGVNLMQLMIAPTVAWKASDNHAFGISPLLVVQQFEAYGLQPFDNAPGFPHMTGAPGSVTNNGTSTSTGVGVRIGYLGKLSDRVSVGVSYSPRIRMSRFDKYQGLFADGGRFDIPENYSMGINLRATPAVTLAFDYARINYAGVASVGNPSGPPVAPLGAANGPGFGWKNINVFKIGVQWQATPQWQLRAGLNLGQNPIRSDDVSFNIVAPGVMTTHYTLGATYAMAQQSEFTFALTIAPSRSVTGPSMFNGFGMPAGNETIRMRQYGLGVQYAWKF